jgi:3-deoxy-manno-octulosonate cytidylyltransferase (CMP-KDO synthetase)
MPDLAIVVPARLASGRFPRKLLHPVKGKPLVLWTAERLREVGAGIPLFFAVDSEALEEPLLAAGFQTVMTEPDLPSGTDRIAVANREIGAAAVINVQADEPLVKRSQIEKLRQLILGPETDMATLATPFIAQQDFENTSQVKVVIGSGNRALYFSRAPIPHNRDSRGRCTTGDCFHHLGMYAYKADFLARFPQLPHGRLEQLEKLEQLRALENGIAILVGITDEPTVSIDTIEDIPAFEAALEEIGFNP